MKDPKDVNNSVRTRNQKKKTPYIRPSMINVYFDYKRKTSTQYEELMNNKNTENESTD